MKKLRILLALLLVVALNTQTLPVSGDAAQTVSVLRYFSLYFFFMCLYLPSTDPDQKAQ